MSCEKCADLHVMLDTPEGDLPAFIERDKAQGKFKNVTVEQAVASALKARPHGCYCRCHKRNRPYEITVPWRTGRTVGRTVYAQRGGEASKQDILIGVMDSPEIAAHVVAAHNHVRRCSGEEGGKE